MPLQQCIRIHFVSEMRKKKIDLIVEDQQETDSYAIFVATRFIFIFQISHERMQERLQKKVRENNIIFCDALIPRISRKFGTGIM